MPTNRLHNWTFTNWDGPTPPGLRQHVQTFTRPGSRGVTHAKLGEWGDPFTATLTEYYASFLAATDARKNVVEPLLNAGPVRLWWNSIDYQVRYQTLFQVVEIGEIRVQTYVSVNTGLAIVYNPGVLTVPLTLLAHPAT